MTAQRFPPAIFLLQKKYKLKQQVQQAMQQIQALEQQLKMKNAPEIIAAQVAKMQAEIEAIKASTVDTNLKALVSSNE